MRAVDASIEARLHRVLEEYLALLKEGRAPDRDTLLAANPELAEGLRSALRALDFVHGARPAAGEPVPTAEPAAGQVLGDYRLRREAGRGGMAVVYEAEQISLGRRVALKVLPFAAVLDPTQLQRFKNEAQAAAQLHHTNIVPVYSVGCERGVHYYAMQFVDGQSLALAIAELRRGTGARPPSPATPITGRSHHESAFFGVVARLGVQAAEALDHAHQVGVIHRDVKPGNLLVDARGHLWVVDFGLARFHLDTGLTMTGDLLGTIRYMSPEQALARRAPVDHRTDVYSLGATLYELCTLEPAFPGDDPHQVLHAIVTRDPKLPRRVNPAVPVDLETILLKAMDKDPARRYATAQEMATDLNRFLEDRPVLARRPSVVTRVARWSKRHRKLLGAAAVVVVVAVAALGAAAARLAREQGETREALTRADRNLDLAHSAVDDFLVQLGVRGLRSERLPTPERRALLEKALLFYDTFLLDRDNGDAWLNRVAILHGLQRHEEALAAAERVLDTHPHDAGALAARGHLLWHLGRPREALDVLGAAARAAPDRGDVHQYRGLVLRAMRRRAEALTAFARAAELEPGDATAQANLGLARLDLGHVDEALAAFDKAIRLAPASADAHRGRADALARAGRGDEALAAAQQAVLLDPASPDAHTTLGNTLWSIGRAAEALAAHDAALALDPSAARIHVHRANALLSLGRAEEALRGCDRAIELDPALPEAHLTRGAVLHDALGRPSEALAEFDRAIELDPALATAHKNRGTALATLGRPEDARAAFDRALEIDPDLVDAYAGRGLLCHDVLRDYSQALSDFDRALALDRALVGLHANRGTALWQLGRRREALDAFACALALGFRPPPFLNHVARLFVTCPDEDLRDAARAVELAREATEAVPEEGRYWNTLGVALLATGSWEDASKALGRAMELRGGGDAWDWFPAAIAYARLGRDDEARASFDRAVTWRREHAPADDALGRMEAEAASVVAPR